MDRDKYGVTITTNNFTATAVKRAIRLRAAAAISPTLIRVGSTGTVWS